MQVNATAAIDPEGTLNPQNQPQQEGGTSETEAGGTTNTGEGNQPQSAIERIPKDKNGNPLYEQATPEDTYDALVEQVGENTAKVLAKKQIDTAIKALEKLNKKIVLIDGQELARYMIEYNVGVSTKQVYEVKKIDLDYFEE